MKIIGKLWIIVKYFLVKGSHVFQSYKAIKNQKPSVAPKARPKAISVKIEAKTVKSL